MPHDVEGSEGNILFDGDGAFDVRTWGDELLPLAGDETIELGGQPWSFLWKGKK